MSLLDYIIATKGVLILVAVLVTNELITQLKNIKANR